MVKTQNELLRDLECHTNDMFRVVEAMIDNNTKEIAELREELEAYRTIFKYIGQVAKSYDLAPEPPTPVETKSLVEVRKYLRDMFGKHLDTYDFMKILVKRKYVSKFKSKGPAYGYRTTSAGVESGWLVYKDVPGRAAYTPRFTQFGIDNIIAALERDGWRKL